mgnify:CR=1 FL=1
MYLCWIGSILVLFSIMLLWIFCSDFFFQAEDGIRDLVRSRGLGDVYKRQHLRMLISPQSYLRSMRLRRTVGKILTLKKLAVHGNRRGLILPPTSIWFLQMTSGWQPMWKCGLTVNYLFIRLYGDVCIPILSLIHISEPTRPY